MTDPVKHSVQVKHKILGSFELYLVWSNLPSRQRRAGASKTIDGYVEDISIFMHWCQGTFGDELTLDGIKADPNWLNRKLLGDFLAWIQTTKGYTASKGLHYAASLRAFCHFLHSEGFIQRDPARGLRSPMTICHP